MAETIYSIRRTDGQLMFGEMTFAIVGDANDWSAAEDDAYDSGCSVTYELVEMTVTVRRTRTLPVCATAHCNDVAQFWGLCETHAFEDDPDTAREMIAARNSTP